MTDTSKILETVDRVAKDLLEAFPKDKLEILRIRDLFIDSLLGLIE